MPIGFGKINIKIKKFGSKIFHNIRKHDGISTEDILASLNPDKNLDNLNFADGGRSNSPILFTHDQKYLVKIITSSEKELFLKILSQFHKKMTDNVSFLSRIYGMYNIITNEKPEITVIILKNMNELSSKVNCLFMHK